MTVIGIVFWLAEHWYVVAAVAALALIAATWGGVLSLGVVIKAALDIAAAVAKFFAMPAEQIAAKILYGVAAAVLGLSIGYTHGKFSERSVWTQREAAHAAAMERLKAEAAAEADEKVSAAAAAEREKTEAAETRIKAYETKLAASPSGDCRISDDDLRAAGDVPRANGLNLRRHPRRMQQGAPRGSSR